MKSFKTSFFVVLILMTGNCWGYGSSGGSTSCKKPQFSNFVPPHNSEVAPGSQFSFMVSRANPDTIQVKVEQQSVKTTVTPKSNVYMVTGKLPDNLKGTYARINITASGATRCKGSSGWLVKITE